MLARIVSDARLVTTLLGAAPHRLIAMAPKNAQRKPRVANNKGGRAGGRSRGRGNATNGRGRGRGRGSGRGGAVIDLTPQNATATGPGPFGMMGGMGMGSGMMMGMPFGGQMPSQFGFGYGGFGNKEASDSVTVKLSLEGAARARTMEQAAQLGAWQKQMATNSNLPLNQHPQWDSSASLYWPLGQGPQAQQQQQHTVQSAMQNPLLGYAMRQQHDVAVPPPSSLGDDGYDEEEDEDDEAEEALDQALSAQKRSECIESFMEAHIGSFMNDVRYKHDASGAYKACMDAANTHADLSTPSRLNEDLKSELNTQMADNLTACFQKLQAELEAKFVRIPAPPFETTTSKRKGKNEVAPSLLPLALALTNGEKDDGSNDSLGSRKPSSKESTAKEGIEVEYCDDEEEDVFETEVDTQYFGLQDTLASLADPPSPTPDAPPGTATSSGGKDVARAEKSPPQKKKSTPVVNPLGVLRGALMHVPVSVGTHAANGIPSAFKSQCQALCDTIAGLIDKGNTPSEFETLLEEFKIFEHRSQGVPTTTACRVGHILYILARGLQADNSAKCCISYADFMATPNMPSAMVRQKPGAVPCSRPGCKCTDRLNRNNKYCCPTCSRGVPCDRDQHFTPEVADSSPSPASVRAVKRGRPKGSKKA